MQTRNLGSFGVSALGLCSVLANVVPHPVGAQRAVLELDHFYVVIQSPVGRAAESLRRAGVVIDTTVAHHDGQGTASLAAFFDNAYLELLWIDPATSVDSAKRSDYDDFRRAADWRVSGASPFGLGLHFVEGDATGLTIPVRRDPAPHLGRDVYYLLLRQPEELLAADLFVMPAQAAVANWIDRFRGRHPDLFAHPSGAHRITRVILHGTPANRARALDLDLRMIRFEHAATQYAIVEFDPASQGREWDLRPVLPLVLRR